MRTLLDLFPRKLACGVFREATLSTSITAPLGNCSAYITNMDSSHGLRSHARDAAQNVRNSIIWKADV
jgi:hypothetical protein